MALYIKQGSTLVEMTEQPYHAEDVLQQLLADQPNLLVDATLAAPGTAQEIAQRGPIHAYAGASLARYLTARTPGRKK